MTFRCGCGATIHPGQSRCVCGIQDTDLHWSGPHPGEYPKKPESAEYVRGRTEMLAEVKALLEKHAFDLDTYVVGELLKRLAEIRP